MSAQSDLRQAIELMQDGDVGRAVDMLNRLVGGAELDDKGQAAAYVWLAESRADSAFKIRCLERALNHEPENQQIRQGLQQLLAAPPQRGQLPTMGSARGHAELDETPLVIGILGGLNGLASGVFVGGAGMIATTSYAIGATERVTVTLDAERHLPGAVVRRFPTYDLALIETSIKLARKPAMAPASMAADNTVFVALGYGGSKLRGLLQQIDRGRAQQWLRTTIPPAHLPDAGGNPLYDENGQLLGLLTRNVDGAGKALASKMSHVVALAEQDQRDRQLLPRAGYCRHCGGRTRARIYGGRNCETCGAAQAVDSSESPSPVQSDKLMALYGEDADRPCPQCGALIGHYNGRCLRCAHAYASGAAAGS